MPRYVEGPDIRLTPNDVIFVDVEFYTGEKYTGVELRRMFPITGLTKYIALVDSEGEQIAIIRDLNDLMEDSRKVAEKALEEYYMILLRTCWRRRSWRRTTVVRSCLSAFISFRVCPRAINWNSLSKRRWNWA